MSRASLSEVSRPAREPNMYPVIPYPGYFNFTCCFHVISAVLPPEATFRGGEYLTYDLSRRGVDPILSSDDEISLHFKTRKSSGLLFYTGE